MNILRSRLTGALAVACLSSLAHADVELDHFLDHESWEAAVGDFTTIDFTGFDHFQILKGDEFTEFGVTLDSKAMVVQHIEQFVNDGEGINAHVSGLWITFDQEIQWFAADHPGTIAYDIYRDGELLATSGSFPGGGVGFFSGIVSSVPFDMIHIFRPTGTPVFIDDLHFGPPIPGPSALGVLAIAGLLAPRRRRE